MQAAGGVIWEKHGETWQPMQRFEPAKKGPDDEPDLRFWRSSIVIGTAEAVERMCTPPKPIPHKATQVATA